MIQKEDLGRLLEYTVWANHRILRPVATLSVAEFKRDLGSSHGGIRGTLSHMVDCEWIWLERWKGVSPKARMDEGEFADVVALRDRWTAIEKHRDVWFRALRPSAVGEIVAYKSLDGKSFEAPLWKLVQHVVNHATYHRGQVTALLRILNTRAVSTDMVVWDRDAKVRARRRES
ncbi:MAG TPA: DinB family protein [Vicinamibacteria bacterium]|jgi:uncharacterized damage-inducible protein DinB|nr:DinB family protein [Vicinamibacteria bacterium]